MDVIEVTVDPERGSAEIEVKSDEGNWLLLGVEFFEHATADLVDEWGRVVPPDKNVSATAEGRGFLCKAYRIARTGIYYAHVTAVRATATVGPLW